MSVKSRNPSKLRLGGSEDLSKIPKFVGVTIRRRMGMKMVLWASCALQKDVWVSAHGSGRASTRNYITSVDHDLCTFGVSRRQTRHSPAKFAHKTVVLEAHLRPHKWKLTGSIYGGGTNKFATVVWSVSHKTVSLDIPLCVDTRKKPKPADFWAHCGCSTDEN